MKPDTDGPPHDIDRGRCYGGCLPIALACRVNMPVLPLMIANQHLGTVPSHHASSFRRDTTFSNTVRMTRRRPAHLCPSHKDLSHGGPTSTMLGTCIMYVQAASLNTEMPRKMRAYLYAMPPQDL